MANVNVLGLNIGAEQMQSLNPLLIMLFVPIFTLWLYPAMGRFAAPLKRMSYGLFLASVSFVLVALIQTRVGDYWQWVAAQYAIATAHLSAIGPLGPPYLHLTSAPNILWQTLPYIVITAAEVFVSTTGLEFAFREAAPEMKSMIMSFWLLTVAVGNLFVALLTALLPHTDGSAEDASVSTGRFLLYAAMMFGVAIIFSLIAATYHYRDKAAAQGK